MDARRTRPYPPALIAFIHRFSTCVRSGSRPAPPDVPSRLPRRIPGVRGRSGGPGDPAAQRGSGPGPGAAALLHVEQHRRLGGGLPAGGGGDEPFRFNAGEDRDFGKRWAREIGPLRFVLEAPVLHCHDLGLGSFFRQHHYHGRGGAHLARLRRSRGEPPPGIEPWGFYGRMSAFPFRGRRWGRGLVLSALMGLSQVATFSGILRELVSPSATASTEPPHPADPPATDSP